MVTPALLTLIGLALALALTLPPLSATRLLTWPMAAAAAVFWLLPVAVALVRLALRLPHSRLGGLLDWSFAGLAATGIASALCSPLSATLMPNLLPFLGAVALPYALLPVLKLPRAKHLIAWFLYPLLFTSGLLWLLDSPGRNSQPFGHANTTGAVCALAACILASLAWRTRNYSRVVCFLHAGGATLAAALTVSSSSRGAVLALAAAIIIAAGLHLLRQGRFLRFASLVVLALAVTIFTNHRLRDLALSGRWSASASESNAQRTAMILGGIKLAWERPALGWGPGSVPHVFPGVRATLPGTPDNYLHLHNTPAQTAATLGLAGLLCLTLLLAALARGLFALRNSPQFMPLTATFAGTGILLLFDHPFATPAFTLLAALPVAALSLYREKSTPASTLRPASHRVLVVLFVVVLGCLVWPLGRDLAARSAWATAQDAAAANQPVAYANALQRAHALAPADPFYTDQLASHLATGHPFADLPPPAPDQAAALWQSSALLNPAHELAHYNAAWLLLATQPALASLHFATAARLAPARAGVWLGLALSQIDGNTPSAPLPALAALAAEVLSDPSFAWSPQWQDPRLAPYRLAALNHAANFLETRALAPAFVAALRNPGPTVLASSAFRRARLGHGVLYGHPDGPAPVDVNILFKVDPPPALADALPSRGFISPRDLLVVGELALPTP